MSGIIISGFRRSRHLHSPSSPYRRVNSLLHGLSHRPVSPSQPHRYRKMVVDTTRRRIHGDSAGKGNLPAGAVAERQQHDHAPSNSDSNSHSHSHGIFGGHSHSHGHDHDHDHGGGLIQTLQSGGTPPSLYRCVRTLPAHSPFLPSFFLEGDRGSRVTLIGLGANVLLTSAKGAAGWFMNSAALLADAGHSLSGEHSSQVCLLATPSPSVAVIVRIGSWGIHPLACALGTKPTCHPLTLTRTHPSRMSSD